MDSEQKMIDPDLMLRFLPKLGEDGDISLSAMSFAGLVCEKLPHSRERSIALTHIEEAVLWTQAALVRRGHMRDDLVKEGEERESQALYDAWEGFAKTAPEPTAVVAWLMTWIGQRSARP
jgi:hypothetical protein